MRRRSLRSLAALSIVAAIIVAAVLAPPPAPPPALPTIRAVLLEAAEVDEARLGELRGKGFDTVVLALRGEAAADVARCKSAAERIGAAGLALGYWIEIARDAELATEHPLWMASLQGHEEWRRHFPDAPRPEEGEVVKVFPWVPVLSKEGFDAHLARAERILDGKPAPAVVFLNDLQGAPSACGCGNTLCRWTLDYGPIVTTTRLGPDAAARFVAAVKELVPASEVVPVWTTECEKVDGADDGACAGVGCFPGRCWKDYAAQLGPVVALDGAARLGVLLPYKAFERDAPPHAPNAGWVKDALATFGATLPAAKIPRVAPANLIPVLQGWDVGIGDTKSQVERAIEHGCTSWVVALSEIEQAWEPRVVEHSAR